MRSVFLGLIVTMLLCSQSFGQIKVADKIDEYKPIIIESTTDASIYIWQVRLSVRGPKNTDNPVTKVSINNNKTLHVWAEPGKYEVNLTTVNIDWEQKQVTQLDNYATFEVLARGAPIPPDPGPNPPPPTPTAFKEKVKSALTKVSPATLTYKTKVAEVYSGIATEAAANPTSWDAALMVNEAKVRNATALPSDVLTQWSGFWPELATAFQALALKPEDLQGHITAFKEVAEVLNQ